jgi:tetratricopeptide (TPR) repeat protein
MPRVAFSVFALCCLVFAAPAAADDWNDCVQTADPEVRIESCSAIVARENETPGNRAYACLNRCHAYLNKGEHDRAIADFGRVLELNPKYADAYFNRAYAYQTRALTTSPSPITAGSLS